MKNDLTEQKTLNYSDADDTQKLIDLINDERASLSVMIFDAMKPITVHSAYDAHAFRKYCDFIQIVGWAEHTADWDPYIIVTLTDGTSYETESGYHSMKVSDDHLYVELDNADCSDDEYEPNEFVHRIAINTIHTIELTR